MNKLNDLRIFYKNGLNKMSEENIDDIKITVCILRTSVFFYIYIIYFLYFIVVIKTYFIHTVHARKRKFV